MSISLKWRLVVAILVFFVIFQGAAIGFAYFFLERSLVDKEQDNLKQLLAQGLHDMGLIFDQGVITVSTLAQNKDISGFLNLSEDRDNTKILDIMDSFNIGNRYSSIYLMDNHGTTYVSTDPSFVGNNYGFRSYFKRAMSDEITVSLVRGVTSQKVGYYFSSPVKDKEGKILGVVVMKMEPEAVYEKLGVEKYLDEGKFMITDEFGVVVYSNDINRLFKSIGPLTSKEEKIINQERRFDALEITPLQYKVVKEKYSDIIDLEMVDFYDSTDKEREILFFGKARHYPFYLIIEKDREEIVQEAKDLTIYLLLILFFGLLTNFIVVIFLVNKILKPLKSMVFAAKKISSGDYSASLEEVGASDLKEVAKSFNDMVMRIKEVKNSIENEVSQRTQELQALNEAMLGREEKMIELKKEIKSLKEKK